MENSTNGQRGLSSVQIKKMVTMALLSALSIILVLVLRVPFPTAPFLEYDPADIPVLVGTILYGPWSGLLLTVVVSAIQATTVSAASGLYGFLMHVVATGITSVVVGTLYRKRKHSPKNLAFALGVGSLAMIAAMLGANLIITPFFMNVPREAVVQMLLPIILPFNAIKAVVNSVIVFFLMCALEKIDINR